jgi:CBS domain containing-hemolysin-like protein
MIVQLGDGRARLDGRASVEELESLFGPLADLHSADYDTVSGLVYHVLQRVPEPRRHGPYRRPGSHR